MSIASRLASASRQLRDDVAALEFGSPVSHVYNPLGYAWRPYSQYLRRYALSPVRVVFLGMNPGPFGMAQTGVPFGEVTQVRDWLGIEARVDRPEPEHPKRPVEGFACQRSEVSGTRLWGAIAGHWGTPERFFADHFIANYCPLVFMEESGRNRTPDKLPPRERLPLFEACDRHLKRLVKVLEPEWVIGVGRFALGRAQVALAEAEVELAAILHPSPANPKANQGWERVVRRELETLGLCRPGSRR
jgi:single-strand selective monofunctional uracil DNA glycosylase